MPRYLPYDASLKRRAQALRRDMTAPERRLWLYLRTLSPRFVRQKPLAHYIVDFYCAGRMLVVEVDGDSHYTPAGRHHDAVRTRTLEGLGLILLRFTNEDVMRRLEGVAAVIGRAMHERGGAGAV